MTKQLSCPTCTAPIRLRNQFVRLVTCDFCDTVSLVHDDNLDPAGHTARITQLALLLFLDAQGRIRDLPFEVAGRLRYQYDEGMWDEWFIKFENDKPGWLTEDEGVYLLYNKQALSFSVPKYEDIRVGEVVKIGQYEMFATEKRKAQIAGGQGQLAFDIMPGETLFYVDGTAGEHHLSLEYRANEVIFLVGREILKSDVVIENEDYSVYYQ